MKKLLSTLLLFALMMSLFGGISSGPDAQAVTKYDFGTIQLKRCNFNTSGYDYDDVQATTLYRDYPVSLFFKRKTGCRIPKGSYVVVFSKNDFNALVEDGLFPPTQTDFIMYKQKNKTRLNYNEFSLTWNSWRVGRYVACLVMPYTGYDNKTWLKYYSWDVTVKNYG